MQLNMFERMDEDARRDPLRVVAGRKAEDEELSSREKGKGHEKR